LLPFLIALCVALAGAGSDTMGSPRAGAAGGLVWVTQTGTVAAALRLEGSAGVVGFAENDRGLWVAGITADGVPMVLSSGTWLARISGPGRLADERVIDKALGVHLPVSLAAAPGGALIVGGEVAGYDLAIQRYSPDGVFERLIPVVQRGVERGGTYVAGTRDGLLLGGQGGERGWFARLSADGNVVSIHGVPGDPPVNATAAIGLPDGAFIVAGTEGGMLPSDGPRGRVWCRRIEASGHESWVTKLLQGRRPDRNLFGARLVEFDAERVLLVSTTTAGPAPGRSFADWRVYVAVIDAQGRVEGEAIGNEPLMAMAAVPAGDGRVWIVGEAWDGKRRIGAAVDFDVASRRFGPQLALDFLASATAVRVHGRHLVIGGVAEQQARERSSAPAY
jgi:hypothetical protein